MARDSTRSLWISYLGTPDTIQAWVVALLWKSAVTIAARSAQEILLPAMGERAARLHVAATDPGLLVHGIRQTAAGETSEISFIDHQYLHASGSYPILPVEQYATQLSLLNLGAEDAEVVAQIYWDRGSYAIGPFRIPAGSTSQLSVSQSPAELGCATGL